MDAKYILLNI